RVERGKGIRARRERWARTRRDSFLRARDPGGTGRGADREDNGEKPAHGQAIADAALRCQALPNRDVRRASAARLPAAGPRSRDGGRREAWRRVLAQSAGENRSAPE